MAPMAGHALKVIYTKGRTINLGNFESTRVDIGIELECAEGDENATFERLRDWVNTRLAKETGR